MTDTVLTASRQAWWEITLLDSADRVIGPLRGVTGGTITLSANTRLRASGSLTIQDTGQDVNWLTDRVRVVYRARDRRARSMTWPVGVFLMSAPTAAHTSAGTSRDVDLSSRLAVLDEDCLEASTTLPAGRRVTDAVEALIASTGEDGVSITPSDRTLASAMVWEAGTPVLTVINDLLDSANYFSLHPDGDGVLTAAPYVRPAARPVAWAFTAGEAAIHSADWSRDQDTAAVPNRVVLVGQGNGDTPALVATAENTDPASPFSREARGRWITHTETGVEASTQAVLDGLARRRLIDLSTPTATIQAAHLPLPLAPNDRVTWDTAGHAATATIQEIKADLTATSLCTTKLREVIDL